ncbi:MAG: DNA mismatch repair protein MutS [Deltaproteobacteria bacterium]|nr:DNA mismatch repair protein MutS [Deltaproteobacteria bacterium]
MNVALQIENHPPMLRQYLEFKQQHPECVLLFQVGDFYETFFEDAVTVSKVLNLTLTSRDKNSADPVPMAGVPMAVVDNYVERLVSAGFSVALVSQVGEVSGRGMVERKLERIITPGIKVLSHSEDASADEAVAALYVHHAQPSEAGSSIEFALAYSEIQSGRVYVRDALSLKELCFELTRVAPLELLLPRAPYGQSIDRRVGWVRTVEKALPGAALKWRAQEISGGSGGRERNLASIPGYAPLHAAAKHAVRLLLHYVDEITVDQQLPFSEIVLAGREGAVRIDAATRSALELVRNVRDGSSAGSLLGLMNRTVTAGGARLLRRWLLNPLNNLAEINRRLAAVGALIARSETREDCQAMLRYITDFERIAARIELRAVTPRELGALRDGLQKLPELRLELERNFAPGCLNSSELLHEINLSLEVDASAKDLLERALADSPPPHAKEGGIFRDGYSQELDRLRQVGAQGKSWLVDLEKQERERSGIASLKIRHNNVQGFFIEVTKANLARVPEHYVRKQSMSGAERFVTEELKRLEQEINSAKSGQDRLEQELYEDLKQKICAFTPEFRRTATGLSQLDVLFSFALLAECEGYCAPRLSTSCELSIKDAKHPVVGAALKSAFVPNSVQIDEAGPRCLIVTGPNMGGKSTYLRQTGLIVIMAQVGSYVPASEACIGLVDRIFARIGASDDLLEGDSTFMVEMREASHIVSTATERSLVLVDEVGRGTATSDGLAIARAIIEWIVFKLKCRTLFATHFHELTALSHVTPQVANLSVGVLDDGQDIVFTHQICQGPANKSYGLEVAKLAGLPVELTMRAREVLEELEQSEVSTGGPVSGQLSLFQQIAPYQRETKEPEDYAELKELREEISALDLNSITPLQAMSFVSELKERYLKRS